MSYRDPVNAIDRMLTYVSPIYDNSRVMKAVYGSQGGQIDLLFDALDEILTQQSITNATWGISYWEEQLGLPIDTSLTLDQRRQRALSKRRGLSRSLVEILQAVEPSLTAAFGGGIIPFTVVTSSNLTEYDFTKLIPTLETRKPAHKTYSFRLLPPDADSGFVIYGDHTVGRGQVALQPESGTLYAGRWANWDVDGEQKSGTVQMASQAVTGSCSFYLAGDLYSGTIVAPSNTSSVMSNSLEAVSTAVTGTGSSFPCGVYECGEEVA